MKYWEAVTPSGRPASRMIGTRHAASATIALLIFDSPTRRSLKMIGTSTTRKPAWTAR